MKRKHLGQLIAEYFRQNSVEWLTLRDIEAKFGKYDPVYVRNAISRARELGVQIKCTTVYYVEKE